MDKGWGGKRLEEPLKCQWINDLAELDNNLITSLVQLSFNKEKDVLITMNSGGSKN